VGLRPTPRLGPASAKASARLAVAGRDMIECDRRRRR